MRLRATILAVLAFAGAASRAEAADTVTFTLLNPTATVAAGGGTVSFNATVAAPATNAHPVYLNGLGYDISPANGFTIDDDAFFNDYPLSLDAGESHAGLLFRLIVPAGSTPSLYSGTITLLGGASDGSQDTLATQRFAVTVAAAAATAVPEPATWALMVLGVGAAGAALRHRRRPMAHAA